VTNSDLEKLVDTNDEWIVKRTGIHTRHIVGDESAVDMAVEATQKAIDHAGIDNKDIGLIIASTITSEYVTPSMADYVKKVLGINAVAMDIGAGCSGFIFSLITAASLMDTLHIDHAVVVASETLSKYTDWTDRGTCVLFGDGAGAVVLKRSAKPRICYPIMEGTADTDDVIYGLREKRCTPFCIADDIQTEYIHMKGAEVFTYAVGVVEDILRKLLQMCGDKPYNKIIPHQANEKIIDYVIRKMDMQYEQCFINIGEYANTSSATIPIAMFDAYEKGWLTKGDRLALVGFGAGLSCGGVVIDWTI
jgi:3-oxoacyl-[acyl-carrier-protein] synthase-3